MFFVEHLDVFLRLILSALLRCVRLVLLAKAQTLDLSSGGLMGVHAAVLHVPEGVITDPEQDRDSPSPLLASQPPEGVAALAPVPYSRPPR